MNELIIKLKEIIDNNGPMYLKEQPYRVYEELLSFENMDQKICAAYLHTLLMDIPSLFTGTSIKREAVSAAIQNRCCFNKETADLFADMYEELFSEEHQMEWKQNQHEGLRSFLKKEWTVHWDGYNAWEYNNVYAPCEYHADFIISAKGNQPKDDHLLEMLKHNPFLGEEEIVTYFRNDLISTLSQEFDEYCEADDYYPPVSEDFDAEYYVQEWCDSKGFTLVSFKGYGKTGNYEPLSRRY